jgi:hypothetical protein
VIHWLAASDPRENIRHFILAIGCREDRDGLSNRFLGGIAEQPLGAPFQLVIRPSNVLLTIASSDDTTIAASQASAGSAAARLAAVITVRAKSRTLARSGVCGPGDRHETSSGTARDCTEA